MDIPTIFVSYSHKDETWKDRVVTHLRSLDRQHRLDTWDDRRIEGGEDWRGKIQEALEAASLAVLLISSDFLASEFIIDNELPKLLDRHLRDGVRIYPIILRPCNWLGLPWLARNQARPTDGVPLSKGDENTIDEQLAAVAAEIGGILSPAPVKTSKTKFAPLPPEAISLARLPTTGAHFQGRQAELDRLDAAWASDRTHILSIVAPGGVGKTALVQEWLNRMEAQGYRGAQRVYAWSFYSQGTGESKAASGDAFLTEALEWFGDKEGSEIKDAWKRGERLAAVLQRQRALLVLDGLEPLQQAPVAGMREGQLKDPGIKALLRNLAAANPGLCVITTREKVEDLDHRVGATVERFDLRELPPEAGAAVLRAYRVKGPDEELQEVSEKFGGHALALTLLGTYLRDVGDGDIRRWRDVPLLEEDAEKGGHAFRVMRSYEKELGEPELEVLYLLGLFDRPASQGEIAALLKEPAIPGLTDKLVEGGPVSWKRAVKRLGKEGARLVSSAEGLGKEGGLDAHPLVRTYFGERLKAKHPEAFRQGHLRLFEHLKAAAPDQPDTLEEMQPLYQAVIHGCRGGKVQEALDEVYTRRIQRGDEFYSGHRLGAIGSELGALSGFFERPWDKISPELTEATQAWVLNETGFDLRAQGRLAEAVAPLQAGVEIRRRRKEWPNAARIAGNLSELLLTLGRVEASVSAARESVELADRSGDWQMFIVGRTALADALHQRGEVEEARSLFEEAETMQAEMQPDYRLLYSLRGYQYCELLLALTPGPSPCPPARTPGRGESGTDAPDLANREQQDSPLSREGGEGGLGEGGQGGEGAWEVLRRAEKFLEWRVPSDSVLGIALDHLTLGRAHLYLGHRAPATEHLRQAVDGLRESGNMDDLPRGLLARAELWRVVGAETRATADLEEAFEIAERGGMRLHLTDAHLERARLRLERLNDVDGAREDVAAAKELVEETGYLRRAPEVEELEAAVGV